MSSLLEAQGEPRSGAAPKRCTASPRTGQREAPKGGARIKRTASPGERNEMEHLRVRGRHVAPPR